MPTILQCAESIQKLGHPIRILVAGDGPLRSLVETTIREKNLYSVIYLGRLEVHGLSRLYERCDIALSSYVADSTVSMPIKAYDYFVAGLPLVNSLGRNLGALVRQHNLGLQYEAENSDSLLMALITLVKNPELRRIARANALALAPTFDCRVQYQRGCEFYRKVRLSRYPNLVIMASKPWHRFLMWDHA